MQRKFRLQLNFRCRLICILVILVTMTMFPSVSRADNPIVQTVYTADPAPLVHNGTVYVYTGHDEDGSTWFTMNEWRVYSSTDMVNWTDHGAPLRYTAFSWASGEAWASQVIYRNGKFYWYVTLQSRSLNRKVIGVAVSNSPTGPFTDALGRPLIANSGADIDPTVFIDTDGQAYLYWGNPNLYYVRLNADMISYSGSIVAVPMTTASFGTRTGDPNRPTTYEEGPWFYKRNSLYYMVFAGGPISEHIGYSTSSGPTGPWTYRGVIMPTQGSSFTNHAGVIDFNGNSYFFYHNGALPGGGGFTRSVAVERFTYNSNGTFPTINMTTSGPPAVGNLNPYVTQQAETMAWSSGVETEPSSEGGMNVGFIDNGDYIKVKAVNFGSGATSFEARVASATSGGNIEIRLGSSTGTLVGTCTVPGTGGWQTWVTRTCSVSGASGIHDLYFRFTGGINFNSWKFNPTGTIPTNTPVGPTPTRTNTPINPTNTPMSSGDGTPYGGTAAVVPGTIQAENYNSGGEGVAYHDNEAANQGGQYRTGEGVDVETVTDTGGGYDVGYTVAGEWMKYTVNVQTSGSYTLTFRLASQQTGGSFHLEVDGVNVTGAIAMPNTGGWQTWTSVTRTGINLTAGQHVLRLVVDGSNGNFNWFSFSTGTAPTNTPAPTSPGTPVGPTPTRTNTPVVPTNTPVAPTATPSGNTCSPVTATITAPFTHDGAGTFCWRISSFGNYINSWNTTSVTVNGVNFTNLWASPGQMPAKASDGYWYISYQSAASWGHFEVR